MLESLVLPFIVSCVFTAFGFFLGKRLALASTVPAIVEEFKIEEIEQEGFHKLLVKFEDSKHRMHRFEFHPSYAHMLSDELVKFAARALSPK